MFALNIHVCQIRIYYETSEALRL